MRFVKMKSTGAAWVLGALTLVSCSSGGEVKTAVNKNDWKLVYSHDGSEVELLLEQMQVYLVEEENEYPEVFEMAGTGVTLVGTFPMDVHVGYDENWPVLVGKTIPIEANGGARNDLMSYVQMPDGTRAFVTGGSLVPEKIEGKIDGMDGDRTMSGTFTLKVRTSFGEEEITGRFAVLTYTLG